jgi:phospholipid/cholesterol/gamma-HCH transport system substrate-binding protein
MRALFKENVGEALVGLLVVLLAVWFVWFAWMRTGGGEKSGSIHVTALFPNSSGVNIGTDVRVAGLKIGSVTDQKLDPESYQVAVTLAIDPKVKIPADSSAAITSEGLLGSTFIALLPGGETTPLKNGDTISDTQGAMDLMGMVGQFINKSGDTQSAPAPSNPAPSNETAAP